MHINLAAGLQQGGEAAPERALADAFLDPQTLCRATNKTLQHRVGVIRFQALGAMVGEHPNEDVEELRGRLAELETKQKTATPLRKSKAAKKAAPGRKTNRKSC